MAIFAHVYLGQILGHIMATSLKLNLDRRRKLIDGTNPICLILNHNNTKSYINLGFYVDSDHWNIDFMRISKGSKVKNPHLINYKIHQKLKEGQEIIDSLELKGKLQITSHPELRKFIINNSCFDKSFTEFLDQIINEYKVNMKEGQERIYRCAKRFIERYGTKPAGSSYSFEEIDYTFLKLAETKFKPRLIGNKNGLSVQMRTIRAVWNRAIKSGIVDRNKYPFSDYKIGKSKTHKTAISQDDLKKLRDLNLKPQSLAWHGRNMFMFSFYTRGMNFVDISMLKWNNIKNGRIEYVRLKTKRVQTIEINENISGILDLYKVENQHNDIYIFPVVKSEINKVKQADSFHYSVNHALKRFAKKLGIDNTLSFNSARHSWATIGKILNIPIAKISQGLGHSSIEVTQIYLDEFEHAEIDEASKRITTL